MTVYDPGNVRSCGMAVSADSVRYAAALKHASNHRTELDTALFEVPSWVSADGCELYFTRAATSNDWNIFVARRP